MRQIVSDNKCTDKQLELFAKQQYLSSSDAEGGYHLTIKERLSSIASLPLEDNHLTDDVQMVEYQSKCMDQHHNMMVHIVKASIII